MLFWCRNNKEKDGGKHLPWYYILENLAVYQLDISRLYMDTQIDNYLVDVSGLRLLMEK